MSRRKWTEEEDRQLKVLAIKGYDATTISSYLDRTEASIRSRAWRLDIDLCRYWTSWSDKEVSLLRHLMQLCFSYKKASNLLDKAEHAVSRKAQDIGCTSQVRQEWTKKEEKILIEGYESGCSLKEVTQRIDRSYIAVRDHALKLGYSFQDNRAFTEEEEKNILQMRSDGHTWEEIGEQLGRHHLSCCYHHKRMENPQRRLRDSVRARFTQTLRHSGRHSSIFNYLPYTEKELYEHLERQFWGLMSWDNYGSWHIDHIRPDSDFNYKDVTDPGFRRSWSLSNLQPMWQGPNCQKSNNWDGQTNLWTYADAALT